MFFKIFKTKEFFCKDLYIKYLLKEIYTSYVFKKENKEGIY